MVLKCHKYIANHRFRVWDNLHCQCGCCWFKLNLRFLFCLDNLMFTWSYLGWFLYIPHFLYIHRHTWNCHLDVLHVERDCRSPVTQILLLLLKIDITVDSENECCAWWFQVSTVRLTSMSAIMTHQYVRMVACARICQEDTAAAALHRLKQAN